MVGTTEAINEALSNKSFETIQNLQTELVNRTCEFTEKLNAKLGAIRCAKS